MISRKVPPSVAEPRKIIIIIRIPLRPMKFADNPRNETTSSDKRSIT